MTITQQMSPSSLRSYKSSRYANGQPQKMFLEAKRAKRVTSQFMSKGGAKKAAAKIKALKKTTKEGKKLWDKLLEKLPGKDKYKQASKAAAGLVQLFYMAGMLAALINKMLKDNEIQDLNIQTEIRQEAEFQKAFQRYQRTVLDLRQLNKDIAAQSKIVERNTKDLDSISKEFFSVKTLNREARKLANDALYEVRQGRVILDGKVAEARKIGNDALYEARQSVTKYQQSLTVEINSLKNQFQNAINSTGKGFQSTVDNLLNRLQQQITKVEVNSIIDSKIAPLKQQPNTEIPQLRQEIKEIKNGLTVTQAEVKQAVVNQGATFKVYDGIAKSLASTYQQTFEAKAAQWSKEQAALSDRFLKEIATGQATTNTIKEGMKYVDDRVNSFIKDVERKTRLIEPPETIKKEINDVERRLRDDSDQRFGFAIAPLQQKIRELETNIREQEKVNAEGNRKLDVLIPKIDSMLPSIAGIPLIAGRVYDQLRPQIPTVPQIGNEVGRVLCNNRCLPNYINDGANRVNQNNNNNADAILKALGAGSDLTSLALLPVINQKLGDQIPGGIGGKLMKFIQWSRLSQALNILTFAATVHNAFQLSSDIGQTLGSALGNVLQLIGIKNEEGQAIDIGAVINSSVENLVKGIIGTENYQQMSQQFAKANRIYQASVNVLNSFQGLASAILTGLEMTAGKVAKIGNALRKSGEVLESAYGWMNPQPKYNRITQTLENLQNGASTIQMVTQAPLDIINATTELTNATTELTNAIKEDDNPANKGKESPEPDELKAKQSAAKTASAGLEMIDLDLEADE